MSWNESFDRMREQFCLVAVLGTIAAASYFEARAFPIANLADQADQLVPDPPGLRTRPAPRSLRRLPLEPRRRILVAFDPMGPAQGLPLVTAADLIASAAPGR